jgi:hypothetical protein
MTQTPRPWFLYVAVATIAVLGIPWALIGFVDILLHLGSESSLTPVALGWIVGLFVGPATLVVALLIIRREPKNVVGLLLLLLGEAYIASAWRLDVDSTLVSTINYAYGGLQWPALFLMIAYFPDGVAFPRRIARFFNGAAFLLFLLFILGVLGEQTFSPNKAIAGSAVTTISNPLYIPVLNQLLTPILPVTQILVFFTIAFGLISLVLRLRNGSAQQRVQIRWLTWSFGILVGLVILGFGFDLYSLNGTLLRTVYNIVFFNWLILFPSVAVGNAILRHKLYDIDLIIRRTLIYTLLTGILAVLYFGGVILTQQVMHIVTGQSSDLAIVISTLLIAALFTPLRTRIQDVIDRRLYRRKYDAEKTLAGFNQTLRDEVDITTLKSSLLGAVNDTMQPKIIMLWVTKAKGENS